MEKVGRSSISGEPIPPAVQMLLIRARRFLFETDEQKLSPPRRWLIITARFLWLVLRAFFRDRVQLRAASLSFSTLLAVVPALALAFAVAQAAGYVDELRDQTVMPFLEEALGVDTGHDTPGVALLRSASMGVLSLVGGTSIAGLGVVGMVVLLIAIWRVMAGLDEAFQHVFENRGPQRSVVQRVRAFLVVAFVAPIGLVYSVTSASLSHGAAAAFLVTWVPIEWLRQLLFFVLPPIVCIATLVIVYMEMPNTEVRFRSALVGAVVGGLAWYGLQLAHVRFQVGLARWNAIYSGFGAFPILMASVQISWVIVLIGAQLVALHQHSPTLRALAAGARRDFATLSALGMEVALDLAGRDAAVDARTLATALHADLVTLRDVLDALEVRGIVSSLATPKGKRYALAIEASALRTSDVLDAIGKGPSADLPWRDASPAVRAVLEAHRHVSDTSEHNVTLAELRARIKP